MKPYQINKLDNHHFQIKLALGNIDLSLFLFKGEKGWLIFDSGCYSQAQGPLKNALKTLKIGENDVRFVVVSHVDSYISGGLSVLRKMFPSAVFVCGEGDRNYISNPEKYINSKFKAYDEYGVKIDPAFLKNIKEEAGNSVHIDLGVKEHEVFDLGGVQLQVVAAAGVSDGCITLWNAAKKWLFASASVQGAFVPNRDGTPARFPAYREVHSYLSSIERIDALKPEIYFSAYWPALQGGEIARFFKDSKDFVSRYDRLILQSSRSPQTAGDIVAACHPRLGQWTANTGYTMIFSLLGHFNRLMKQRKMKGAKNGANYKFQSL
ncbi:MAG: MBL fold metallo-hydrolase [Verrucomicrobiota bacterium]|nr:MBL fold metallo-hydrolase [Verrucomicrobiota bacterium]